MAGLAARADDTPQRRAAPQLQQRINRCIAAAVDNLRRTQEADGSWPHRTDRDQRGGYTAIALYALAASGVPADDDTIRRGLQWVRGNPEPFGRKSKYGTYCASLLVLALTRIDGREHRPRVHELAGLLVGAQGARSRWNYRLRPHRAGDNSNSQFAVLALAAAQRLSDYQVPRKTWVRVESHYRKSQHDDGGWGYNRERTSRPSMCCAGLASYVLADAALHGGLPRGLPHARASPVAELGLRAVLRTDAAWRSNPYFLYGLERCATLLGVPDDQWYFDAARAITGSQRSDGGWGNPFATSLNLLVLTRATRYATTHPDPGRRRPLTRTARDPDPKTEPARAFDFYHHLDAAERERYRPRFGGAGPAAVAVFIERLGDKRARIRKTAWELFRKLIDKHFLFDPRGAPEERAVMLEAIREWWRTEHERVRWDEERGRFVVR